MKKMRATYHNARTRVDGSAFNPKHNDRDFSIEDADNIHPEQSHRNVYWNAADNKWYTHEERDGDGVSHTFKTAELEVYKELFWGQYVAQQKRHEEKRQYGRMKTFEEWVYTKLHCPEETFLQIGKTGDGNHPDAEVLHVCGDELIEHMRRWSEEHGEPYRILDIAYHFDEQVPQLHVRKVWMFTDEDGELQIGQKQALEQAGVEPPKPDKREGRYNSRKMTYDAEIREAWYAICEQHGLTIEREPLPPHKSKTKQRMLYEREEELAEKQEELATQVENFEADRAAAMQEMEFERWAHEQELADAESESYASAEVDAMAIVAEAEAAREVAEARAEAAAREAEVSETRARDAETQVTKAQEQVVAIVEAAKTEASELRQAAEEDAKSTRQNAEIAQAQADLIESQASKKLQAAEKREQEARTARDAYRVAETAYKDATPTVAGVPPVEFAKRLIGRLVSLATPRKNPMARMANFGDEAQASTQQETLGNQQAFNALKVVRGWINKALGGIERVANDVAREIAREQGKTPKPEKQAIAEARQAEKDWYANLVGSKTEMGGTTHGRGDSQMSR